MIPRPAKLKCLPRHTSVCPYEFISERFLTGNRMSIFGSIASAYADVIISVAKVDSNNDDPQSIIDEIHEIYERLSFVSGMKNNYTKNGL